MQEHERVSYLRIATLLAKHRNPLLLLSGGKDSLVVAFLLKEVAGCAIDAFTEISTLFPDDENDVRLSISALGYFPHYHYELTYEKLSRHYTEVMPPCRYVFWKMDVLRHRASIPKYINRTGHDLLIFGRRLGENSVGKGHYYSTNGRHTLLPIREWTTAQVWEFIRKHNIFYPRQYDTGLHQLRTWVGYLNEAYKENARTYIENLWKIYPEAVMGIAPFYKPATDYVNENQHGKHFHTTTL